MYTILFKSVSEKKLKNFRSLKWKSSKQVPNTLTETFWRVRTPAKMFNFIEYFKMKSFFDVIQMDEWRMLFDAPGVLEDDLFMSLLKARYFGVPQNILLLRLQALQRLKGQTPWNSNLYYTYKGVFAYEVEEVRSSIRKVKKYSGYVRNSSAVGSKRSSGASKPEPEIFEWKPLNEEIDFFGFLTVGRFTEGFLSKVTFFPEDDLTRSKRSMT